MPHQKETAIIFIGDSQIDNFQFEERFPNSLNRGIGGDTTGGVRLRISESARHYPKAIFLQVGVNDIVKEGISIKRAASNIEAAIDTVQRISPSTEIYIQSIFPVGNSLPNRDSIPIFNNQLKRIASEKGAFYIDLYSVTEENGALSKKYDTGDGVHLSLAAYEMWSGTVSNVLDKKLLFQHY